MSEVRFIIELSTRGKQMFDYDDQDERIIEALEEVMEDGGFVSLAQFEAIFEDRDPFEFL
jgi:hypothetical protein